MSYNISLLDPVTKAVIKLDEPHFMRGGTYALGGTRELELNVTYNYGKHFNYKQLNGLSGVESISILSKAIDVLANDVNPDYWAPTEGNVKASLIQLRTMAQMHPDGIWDVQ